MFIERNFYSIFLLNRKHKDEHRMKNTEIVEMTIINQDYKDQSEKDEFIIKLEALRRMVNIFFDDMIRICEEDYFF